MKSVMKANQCIGFIVACVKGFKAHDSAGRSIGVFESERDAALAVYQQADTTRPRASG